MEDRQKQLDGLAKRALGLRTSYEKGTITYDEYAAHVQDIFEELVALGRDA